MCLCHWGKLQAKSYKKTKIRKQCHYWEASSKTGRWEQKLDTAQAPHTANVLSFQLCTTLSDNMDCSSPGSPVHWILQARVVELPCPPPGDLPDAEIEHTANGWANHLHHPSVQTLKYTLTLTPFKEPAQPPSPGEQASGPVTYSCSPLIRQGPK